MATAPLRSERLTDILSEVEDLLLDAKDDPWLIVGDDERTAINVFEDIATRAIEDGKPVLIDPFTADVLYEHNIIDQSDFVAGVLPVSDATARWMASHPDDCTQLLDGICRCVFTPRP